MGTLDAYINSIGRQFDGLQTLLKQAETSGSIDDSGTFLSSLEFLSEATAKIISAISSDSGQAEEKSSGVQTPQISPSTMSALIQATSESASDPAQTEYLLQSSSVEDTSHKPDMAEFMVKTGADAATASDILYGAIGSNTDLRNWKAIMYSSDPIGSARAATAALYNSSLDYASPNAIKTDVENIMASSGNFTYAKYFTPSLTDPLKPVESAGLFITDGAGNILSFAADPELLAARSADFGFDTHALSDLQDKLDALGVEYRTGVWSDGFVA